MDSADSPDLHRYCTEFEIPPDHHPEPPAAGKINLIELNVRPGGFQWWTEVDATLLHLQAATADCEV